MIPVFKYILIVVGVIILGIGLTKFLSPRDVLKKVDAIVAISGGDTTDRAQQAINLYKERWADKIIFSGAALDPLSPSNAEIMRSFASHSGIPAKVINIEESAQNTPENASNSQAIIKQNDFDSIILVTSPYHQRRAYLEFRDKLGPDVEIINYPVTSDNWAKTWWFSPGGWYITTSETIKVGITIIKNLF